MFTHSSISVYCSVLISEWRYESFPRVITGGVFERQTCMFLVNILTGGSLVVQWQELFLLDWMKWKGCDRMGMRGKTCAKSRSVTPKARAAEGQETKPLWETALPKSILLYKLLSPFNIIYKNVSFKVLFFSVTVQITVWCKHCSRSDWMSVAMRPAVTF